MSRLTDLLAQARKIDPQLAADLEAEFRQLTRRNQFGLVFERHQPEAVELPGRPVRRGDTVRVLPPRGTLTIGDTRHWVVTDLERTPDGKQAHLTEADVDPEVREPATSTAALEDLVVVARFEDPIYPGLVETGRVENGGPDKPFHTVINAENFHALEMLTYTHRHKVDCIYIDPPYNTGAKDWKYNNDYVASDDDYRHSKWLSFMERRLQVARELLNPEDSVLIVTIDEKEYLRLGMLLEQTFPEARIQMVSSAMNAKGVARNGYFRRTDEYIYFLMLGRASPSRLPLISEWDTGASTSSATVTPKNDPGWTSMMRRGSNSRRQDRPNGFYPIYVDPESRKIVSVGAPIPPESSEAPPIRGLKAVLPIRRDGSEGRWQVGADELMVRQQQGRVRLGRETHYGYVVNYLPDGAYASVLNGQFKVIGNEPDGSLTVEAVGDPLNFRMAPTQWKIASHNASEYGTTFLRSLLPGRAFPFPKSLYAVEDALRFFIQEKPHAVVLDFFSGSGTTAHAVMRLNKQDGGRRQCISVTNNEVSAEEQKGLRVKGLRPGDAEWEQWGICDYVTKPRVTAAITGKTPAGDPIKGEYKFTDEFPMADGFGENAAFFTLTYEAPRQVRRNRAFARIAPMLWLKAGSRGRIISNLPERGWDVAQAYGVLEDMDHAPEFLAALEADPQVGMAFIVTDSEVAFQSVARQLPEHTTAVRLYESYLHNFQINRRA
ncbi:DNA methyltransferase [Micrococcus luteus]|uniref:site-specific DNA-methyltransferase n=1 Tax=Micrococcus luteus TaxID=1270 RepID=UPI0011A9E21D|nr:DNA methyltransferase [Micrococcus luteus]MCT1940638.1 site-specific DNA-methyltransferase [Micrococcus luteus]MCV7607292.1 DNA methyltransferase [Micrococcus luteus]MCV7672440.1 DNA methyltransferase [Micrococcus luteus]MCV7708359.1 DNA methyltransferase [Micrococcus luteus]MCV7724166.1 DNA methyltransferase [Micrococcus luteus]